MGFTSCLYIGVNDMDGLFNKVSNGVDTVNGGLTGNSIVTTGEILALAVGEYKCSEGACSGTDQYGNKNMLHTQDFFGVVKCNDDNRSCVVDGESTYRFMWVRGTGGMDQRKLSLRGISYKDGKGSYGGGFFISDGIVNFVMCSFTSCNADSTGGALHIDEGTANFYGVTFSGNSAGNGDDINRSGGSVVIHSNCPYPYSSRTASLGDGLDTYGSSFSGSTYTHFCYYVCPAGYHNPTLGTTSDSCQSCPSGTRSSKGSTACLDIGVIDSTTSQGHHVTNMGELFNTVSNDATDAANTGNSIMPFGDTTVLASGEYKCSQGTCALGNSNALLSTNAFYGNIVCISDSANCVIDGENTNRGMRVNGSGGNVLTLKALTFKDGEAETGGGLEIRVLSILDLHLCVFSNCRATSNSQGGGAIYSIYSNTGGVNIYGTTFTNNNANTVAGNDIYESSPSVSITVHNTCPSPFSSNTPNQGSALDTAGMDSSAYSYECYYKCIAGYYNPDGGLSSSCVACGAGKYSNSAGALASDCISCPAGKSSSTTAETSEATCTSCGPGEYAGEGSASCSTCSSGKKLVNSATSVEGSACATCAAGEYASFSSVYCTACGAGKYSHTGSRSCPSCGVGKYLANSATGVETSACTICGAGTLAPTSSSSSCTICSAGKYNPDPATDASLHLSCTACPIGKKNEDTAMDVLQHNALDDCLLCTPGTYNDEIGASACKSCADGQISGSGASSCSSCPAGYECKDSTQIPCGSGTYSNSDSNCLSCELGHKCPGGTDKIACVPGSFQGAISQPTCDACPAGKYQPDEAKLSCLPCTTGYFCPESSTSPIPCGSVALFCPPASAMVVAVGSGNYTTPTNADENRRDGQEVSRGYLQLNNMPGRKMNQF